MKVDRIDTPPPALRRHTAPGAQNRSEIDSDDAVMFQPEDDSEGNSEQQQEQSGGGGASPRHEFAPRTPTGESRVPIEITTIPEAVETEVDGVPAAAPAAEKKGLNVVV